MIQIITDLPDTASLMEVHGSNSHTEVCYNLVNNVAEIILQENILCNILQFKMNKVQMGFVMRDHMCH